MFLTFPDFFLLVTRIEGTIRHSSVFPVTPGDHVTIGGLFGRPISLAMNDDFCEFLYLKTIPFGAGYETGIPASRPLSCWGGEPWELCLLFLRLCLSV